MWWFSMMFHLAIVLFNLQYTLVQLRHYVRSPCCPGCEKFTRSNFTVTGYFTSAFWFTFLRFMARNNRNRWSFPHISPELIYVSWKPPTWQHAHQLSQHISSYINTVPTKGLDSPLPCRTPDRIHRPRKPRDTTCPRVWYQYDSGLKIFTQDPFLGVGCRWSPN